MKVNPSGIMFHHFHNDVHPMSQGSISAGDLDQILRHIGRDNILSPNEWRQHADRGELAPHHTCITLDDTLLCQYDVAKPVLDKWNIKAFWFVNSGPLLGQLEPLEIYRHFRTMEYPDIAAFYADFFEAAGRSPYQSKFKQALGSFVPENYLKEFPFYTPQDRTFRFVRDRVLGKAAYDDVMQSLMKSRRYDVQAASRLLWMKESQVKQLQEEGHEIGMHSHTHPTTLGELDRAEQQKEYELNFSFLKKLLNVSPTSMSHPCNSYSGVTLDILRNMGITVGFRSNPSQPEFTNLEFPRIDHAVLMAEVAR